LVFCFIGVLETMDSEGSSFQSGLVLSSLANMPPRCPAAMPAGEIVAWTPTRILAVIGAWIMEETHLPSGLPASICVTVPKRSA
jgi:hypothetical protein